MVIMGEPNEVGCTIVVHVTVAMMALVALGTRTNPRESDEQMTIRRTFETAHPRVVGMHVRFGAEVFDVTTLHRVQSPGREGEEDAHAGAIESCAALSCYCAYTQTQFRTITQIDLLFRRCAI